MNRAIAQLCIFVGAVFTLSGYSPIGVTRSLSAEGQQTTATGWKINFDESGSNPVIADGILYVGSADGAVYALDPKTGETKWRFQTGESLSPATSGPQIITVPRGTSINDQIAAAINTVEKQRGEGRRRVDMIPAVENGTVFIGSGDHSFYAIDAATGKKKWSYVAGPGMDSISSAAVIKNGTCYFVTEDGLHALDALTGKRKWLFETLEEIPKQKDRLKKRVPTGPVMGDGVIFLTAWPFSQSNTPEMSFLYAIQVESGALKWKVAVDGDDPSLPCIAKGLVFFSTREGAFSQRKKDSTVVTLHAVDASSGKRKWTVERDGLSPVSRPPMAIGDLVIFGTDRGLFALNLETGDQLWSFSADAITPDLQADDQHLYVVTHKGSFERPNDTIHALALTTGREKWSRGLNVRLAMVHDGVVYANGKPLHAIDAATGMELWSFKGSGRVSARLISEGRIFLTSPTISYFGTKRVDQGYLYAIDAKTGKLKP